VVVGLQSKKKAGGRRQEAGGRRVFLPIPLIRVCCISAEAMPDFGFKHLQTKKVPGNCISWLKNLASTREILGGCFCPKLSINAAFVLTYYLLLVTCYLFSKPSLGLKSQIKSGLSPHAISILPFVGLKHRKQIQSNYKHFHETQILSLTSWCRRN